MKDLIERLEKATGPDQELDLAVAMACQIDCRKCCGRGVAVWAHDGNGIVGEECCGNPDVCPANYTASLDAALTLVPEGWAAILYTGAGTAELYERPPAKVRGIQFRASDRPSIAIALCIAALKARDAVERDLTKMEAGK
jgi:hypothetical protein